MKLPGSFRKTWDVLLPFIIYNAACIFAQMVLLQLLQISGQYLGDSYLAFIAEHPGMLQGIMTGLYISAGLFAIRRAARKEIGPLKTVFRPAQSPAIADAPRSFPPNSPAIADAPRSFPPMPPAIADPPKPLPIESLVRPKLPQLRQLMEYMLMAALAFTSALGINILFSVTGITKISDAYSRTAENQAMIPFGIGVTVFGLISPLAEEVLFRGIIYNRMKKHYPLPLAILLSSFLFAIYHQNIVQGVYAMIMGLLIVFAYYRYNAFLAPVLFHSIANISIYVLSYNEEFYRAAVRPGVGIIFIAASTMIFVIIQYIFHKKSLCPPEGQK